MGLTIQNVLYVFSVVLFFMIFMIATSCVSAFHLVAYARSLKGGVSCSENFHNKIYRTYLAYYTTHIQFSGDRLIRRIHVGLVLWSANKSAQFVLL